ncbi:MAG: DNA-directed RNA polymerase subunit omega [Blastocatellia bacterium]|nr:DNA-directed RNA polymerase subunit omega [Blastocatellia bacterium]
MTEKVKKELLSTPDSKYRLILIAARRSKQLQKGASPRVNSQAHKPTRVALEEIQKGTVRFEILPPRREREE